MSAKGNNLIIATMTLTDSFATKSEREDCTGRNKNLQNSPKIEKETKVGHHHQKEGKVKPIVTKRAENNLINRNQISIQRVAEEEKFSNIIPFFNKYRPRVKNPIQYSNVCWSKVIATSWFFVNKQLQPLSSPRIYCAPSEAITNPNSFRYQSQSEPNSSSRLPRRRIAEFSETTIRLMGWQS